ncbi:MAG: response regulator [Paenibacillus sp.]|nr:response regulator [Paenibacillus sp.]
MRIVIADDQPSTHQFLNKMIDWTSLGVTGIHHAYHGREAVELIQELSPDLLVLDLRMPVLDGIGVLQEIRHMPRKPKTMILSAHDEFEYARDAMKFGVRHYLLKPVDIAAVTQSVEELGQEVRQEARDGLERIMAKVCRLKSMDAESVQSINTVFQTLGIHGYLCVFVTAPDGEAGKILSLLPSMPYQWAAQSNLTDIYLIQGMTDREDPSGIVRLYREQLPEGAVIGVSRVQQQSELLVTGLLQCESAAKTGFYEGYGVYLYSEAALLRGFSRQETDDLVRGLASKLEPDYSEQALERAVSTLFAAFRHKRVMPETVYQICYHLLFMMVTKYGGSREKLSVGMVQSQKTLQQLQAYFSKLMLEMIRSKEESSFSPEDTIHQIKRYVETNYSDDLSLDRVAAKFIMNKYQLCRLFKREFGISYWSYVTRIRMEKAAELLLYTPYKVAHIALKTGYPDESHFSNVFKKYYGIRPKDYKQNHTQESSTTNQ